MVEKIKLGISSCLLGEKVRYDGGHKLDHYLADSLGRFVDWVPVCPEVETGLGIPREAMRLIGSPDDPRLMTRSSGVDHTDRMQRWAQGCLRQLEQEELSGFIFKSRSPSSGMARVKIYSPEGMPGPVGSGIFARALMDAFPLMPVEDDGRLHDPALRENFIERVFVYSRWRELCRSRASVGALVDFHSSHKYLLMAHSPSHLRQLGRVVANAGRLTPSQVYAEYLPLLMEGLKLKATVKKNTNVLQHMVGYFKQSLSQDEKQELLEVIGEYHQGLVPLVVPVTLLNHFVRKYREPYLARQSYLNPHPLELMLRNHV
ncbi:MAG: YbgA family protein [Thermoleophilia bacterium]